MLCSLALVSLLSASLVSRLTAERVENSSIRTESDLSGRKLAAVAQSSRSRVSRWAATQIRQVRQPGGSSFVFGRWPFQRRRQQRGRVADIWSPPALGKSAYVQRALLAPAFMAIALPENSPLKRPIDRALIKITASPEWKSVEELYFGQ